MNHYPNEIALIEKFDENKTYAAVYYDADQKHYYTKRFKAEYGIKETSFIGENKKSKLIHLFNDSFPRIEIEFGGKNKKKQNQIINLHEFIGEKSYRARGKRLTTAQVKKINVLDPLPEKINKTEEENQQEQDSDQEQDDERSQMSLEF
jgi:topoisomerase-4 subunit A